MWKTFGNDCQENHLEKIIYEKCVAHKSGVMVDGAMSFSQ